MPMCSAYNIHLFSGWVAPFGYPRIYARSQLPVNFRSLPRPSSPPDAKTSTICPYYLDQTSFPYLSKNNPPSAGEQKF